FQGGKLNLFPGFLTTTTSAFPTLSAQWCQRREPPLENLKRDDAHVPGVAPRVPGVIPSGDEEDVDAGAPDADRFLRGPADRRHRPVELDLSGSRDLVPAVDVATEQLGHLEREREPCRGAADLAKIDL